LLENLCFTRFLHENPNAPCYSQAGDPEGAQTDADPIPHSLSAIHNTNSSGDVDRRPAIFNFYA